MEVYHGAPLARSRDGGAGTEREAFFLWNERGRYGTLEMMWLSFLVGLAFAKPPQTEAERLQALDDVYERFDFGFPKVDAIDAKTLRSRLQTDDSVLLVDVRPVEERQVSMLPGAISLEEYEARRATTPEAVAGKTVVTYCTVGVRSGFAANKLRKDGVEVLNFRGSILGWTHEGGALVTPAGEATRQVHVYGKRWDFAADGYEPVITDRSGAVELTRPRESNSVESTREE